MICGSKWGPMLFVTKFFKISFFTTQLIFFGLQHYLFLNQTDIKIYKIFYACQQATYTAYLYNIYH